MHITDLDEYQGVTPEMIRDWLRKRGWAFHDGKHRYWGRGKDNLARAQSAQYFADSLVDGNRDDVAFVIHCEVLAAGMSPQEALREINPRMRKGIPSQEALRAHRGLWLRSLGKENIATVLSRQLEEFPSPRDAESCFWPCDENYNKTRWPTDANGVML